MISAGKTDSSIKATGPFDLSGWRKWLFLVSILTVIGLLQAVRLYYLYNTSDVEKFSWGLVISWSLAEIYLWGILSIFIVFLVGRIGFDRHKWLRILILHFILGLAFSLVHLAAYVLIFDFFISLFMGEEIGSFWRFSREFSFGIKSKLLYSVLIYFLIAFVTYTARYFRRLRDEERRLANLETKLARAQLEVLKNQLHPHFLFNTLNAITTLIHTHPEAADRIVTKLGELLRISIDSKNINEVPLRNELEFLEKYIDIQRIRFGDRFRVSMDISPDTPDALVPNFVLQPLVENTVKHVLSKSNKECRLRINSFIENKFLVLEVNDNGPGMDYSHSDIFSGNGGLSNLHERLEQLYGENGEINVQNLPEGGLKVKLKLPYMIEQTDSDD